MTMDSDQRALQRPHEAHIDPLRGEEQKQGFPLMEAIGRVVMEFEKLPSAREEKDFPDAVAYLLNQEQGSLVMVRRRRPMSPAFGKPKESTHEGYFAEVFDITEEGESTNGFSDVTSLNGLFVRTEISDGDDPLGAASIPPTSFGETYRSLMEYSLKTQLQALKAPGEKAQTGVLGQLFSQKDLAEATRQQSSSEDQSIRERIRTKFFDRKNIQGLSTEVGNEHFVITEEDESDVFFFVGNQLGLPSHRVRIDREWEDKSSFREPTEQLRDAQGKLPLVVTIDSKSLDRSTREDLPKNSPSLVVVGEMHRYAKEHPLFALVNILDDLQNSEEIQEGDERVGRVGYGHYWVHGKNPQMLQDLYMKIGIDYMLTLQTRDLVNRLR